VVLGGYYYKNNSVNDSSMSKRGRVNLNLRYRFTDRLSAGVNTVLNRSKGSSFFFWKGNNELLLRPGAAVSKSNSLRYNIDPYLIYFDPANNKHKVLARFYSIENITGTSEADQTNISDFYYTEYQVQRPMENIGLVATAGFVYNGNKVRAQLYGDTAFSARNLAGYLQLDKKFFDRLNLSFGFRFEENLVLTPDTISYNLIRNGRPFSLTGVIPDGKIRESKPVFRVGASYKATEYTFLRASWGQGYRFPTIAEKFIFTLFGGVPISPNFMLNSETGWSLEAGIRQGFKISEFSGFLDVAGFWSEYSDMMEFTFVDLFLTGFQSQNVGDTRIKGIEASITGVGNIFGLETSVLFGWTFIDPKFKQFAPADSIKFGSQEYRKTDAYRNAVNSSICHDLADCKNILKYRYRHAIKLDMESKLKKASLGLSINYNSNMENIDEIFEALVVPGLKQFRQEHPNGHIILGARAAYHFTEYLKASLIGNNLLNQEYSSRPGLLEAPRNVSLRLDFEF
jgi:iron complex outermembrane receptor protein